MTERERSWMLAYRNYSLPNPGPPFKWKNIDKITPDTLKILEFCQDYSEKVAIFSWHPEIQHCKWYKTTDSNYNQRLTTETSVTILLEKANTREFSEKFRKFVNSFPYMEVLGSSGDRKEDGYSYTFQISFLREVSTVEDSWSLKKEKITAGAYKLQGEKWLYIPSEDFDYLERLEKSMMSFAEKALEFFSVLDGVKVYPVSRNLGIQFPKFKFLVESSEYFFNISIHPHFNDPGGNLLRFSMFHRFNEHRELSFYELLSAIQRIFPKLVPSSMMKDFAMIEPEKAIEKILHDKRGKIQGRKFGI